mgnify:CR=1 FL=1
MAKAKYSNKTQYHGKTKTKLYKTFRDMKNRCFNKNDYHYKWYGAKGVSICKEWLDDFMSFYNWSYEHGYKEGLTIDRIDVNGNYEPANCRWVTLKENCNNRTNNRIIEIDGVEKTLAQWEEETGIERNSIARRYDKGIRGKDLISPLPWKKTNKKIIQKDLNGNIIEIFDSPISVKRKLGFCTVPIISVCKKKKYCHTAYGYLWEYGDKN